jgi:hypothetical protein
LGVEWGVRDRPWQQQGPLGAQCPAAGPLRRQPWGDGQPPCPQRRRACG